MLDLMNIARFESDDALADKREIHRRVRTLCREALQYGVGWQQCDLPLNVIGCQAERRLVDGAELALTAA